MSPHVRLSELETGRVVRAAYVMSCRNTAGWLFLTFGRWEIHLIQDYAQLLIRWQKVELKSKFKLLQRSVNYIRS